MKITIPDKLSFWTVELPFMVFALMIYTIEILGRCDNWKCQEHPIKLCVIMFTFLLSASWMLLGIIYRGGYNKGKKQNEKLKDRVD